MCLAHGIVLVHASSRVQGPGMPARGFPRTRAIPPPQPAVQCEEGVLVTEELRWRRHIPCLDSLQGLYLEFVRLDARVLANMRALRELRLLFDQWEVAHQEVFAQLPALHTLYLEPATPNALCAEARAPRLTRGQGCLITAACGRMQRHARPLRAVLAADMPAAVAVRAHEGPICRHCWWAVL